MRLMKKNQTLLFSKTIFALLAFFALAVGCKKTDLSPSVSSAASSSASSNDETISLNGFKQVNIVANKSTYGPRRLNPRLQNAWGISASPGGIIWLSANETGLSFVDDTTGAHVLPPVTIPSHKAGVHGNPTGNIFNPTADFIIPGTAASAKFIFADEGGTISAWNGGTAAIVVADRSASGAIYKGL